METTALNARGKRSTKNAATVDDVIRKSAAKTPQKQTKQVKYARLAEDEIQEDEKMLETGPAFTGYRGIGFSGAFESAASDENHLKKHEIYENTYYIPNSKIRILETPMNSSLSFQMLLYYHFFFDVLYLGVTFTTIIYKLWVFKFDIIVLIALIIGVFLWFPVELARLNFGYKGNINETFPELIAFIIFTIFFIIPFSIVPWIQGIKFPHENPLYYINYIFIIFELVLGFVVMCRFMNTQSAAFYLRTAPLIDRIFKLKYQKNADIKSSREVELGLRRFDKMHDAAGDTFDDSDAVRESANVQSGSAFNGGLDGGNHEDEDGAATFGGRAKLHFE